MRLSPLDPHDYSEKQALESQLYSTINASITAALATSPARPLLTHLNADTTWLFSIPYPKTAPNILNRKYYHVLIDPWLVGGQSDVAPFFSQQWHATPSCVQRIVEVEQAIWRVENSALGRFWDSYGRENEEFREEVGIDVNNEAGGTRSKSWIDLVVVSHEFTDHMHKETLLEVNKRVPVFATAKAAGIIRSWGHFERVLDVPRFGGDWRHASTELLPEWIGVFRVAYDGPDLLYYHSAIMITFSSSRPSARQQKDVAEALIYTPHGIDPMNLTALVHADPPIQTLALLHGLQDIQINTSWASSMKAQLNKGAHNGLKVQRMLNSKYWIGTHDEVKKGGGIVSWFLDRKLITLQEAVNEEKKKLEDDEGISVDLGNVRFEELGNGESLILK